MDVIVEKLTSAGLMVILNNHIGKAGWCCSPTDSEGLWYSDAYTEDQFFDHWAAMATRYRSNPLVVGADLRNELRRNHTTYCTWGFGSPETDWHAAAEEAGRRVLEANPDMLVFVEGIIAGGVLTGAR